MTRVIHLMEAVVIILISLIGGALLWIVASPIAIHLSNAFAGTVSSLTPDQQQITATLTAFGAQEQNVNIAAPDASSTIANAYGPYVIPSLLAQWEADPASAPGRVVQSPWPDHIIVNSIVASSTGYTVNATLVLENDQAAARGSFDSEDPLLVTFVVYDRQWMISSYTDESGGGS